MKKRIFIFLILIVSVSLSVQSENSATSEILLIKPRNFLKKVVKMIRRTQSQLYLALESCEFENDNSNSVYKVLREIVYLNSRGVQVEVLLEGGNGRNFKKLNVDAFRYLSENGIKVYVDSGKKDFTMNFIIFDDFTSIVTSGGFSDEYFKRSDSLNMWIESEEFVRNLKSRFEQSKQIAKVDNLSLLRNGAE